MAQGFLNNIPYFGAVIANFLLCHCELFSEAICQIDAD
jgi:C4-type Zn-finger protein